MQVKNQPKFPLIRQKESYHNETRKSFVFNAQLQQTELAH